MGVLSGFTDMLGLTGNAPAPTPMSEEEKALLRSQTELLDFGRGVSEDTVDIQRLLQPELLTQAGFQVERDADGNIINIDFGGEIPQFDQIQNLITSGKQITNPITMMGKYDPNITVEDKATFNFGDQSQGTMDLVSLLQERAYDALAGELPTDPALLRELDEREEKLMRELQADFGSVSAARTSSPGMERLVDFERFRNEAIFSSRQRELQSIVPMGVEASFNADQQDFQRDLASFQAEIQARGQLTDAEVKAFGAEIQSRQQLLDAERLFLTGELGIEELGLSRESAKMNAEIAARSSNISSEAFTQSILDQVLNRGMTLGGMVNPNIVSQLVAGYGGVQQAYAQDRQFADSMAFNAFQADQEVLGSLIGAAATGYGTYAGLAALGGSDRRLKKNIRKIGENHGLNIYEWDYIWGEHSVGFMADEVKEVYPDAVVEVFGYDHVDYRKVIGG